MNKIFREKHKHISALFFILFMLFLAAGSNAPKTEEENSSAVTRGEHTIAKGNFVGSRSKETYNKLMDYAIQKDTEAFKKLLAIGLFTGEFVNFSPGEKVFVTDTSILQGLVKIRRNGETIEYWTQLEAVK